MAHDGGAGARTWSGCASSPGSTPTW
jgi:hypothetical protein